MLNKYKTNSNHVKNLVIEHVKSFIDVDNYDDYSTPQEVLKQEIDNLIYNDRGINEAAYDYIMGGSFLISYYDQEQFLNSLGINPENKEYSNDQIFKLYNLLVSRAILAVMGGK